MRVYGTDLEMRVEIATDGVRRRGWRALDSSANDLKFRQISAAAHQLKLVRARWHHAKLDCHRRGILLDDVCTVSGVDREHNAIGNLESYLDLPIGDPGQQWCGDCEMRACTEGAGGLRAITCMSAMCGLSRWA